MRSNIETFTEVLLFKEFPRVSPDKKFKLREAPRMFIYTFYTNISELSAAEDLWTISLYM